MTDTIAPKTGASPEVASAVAQFFTPIVHELITLAVNGKQAHWHVRGHNFIGVHEFLDTVVTHAQDWSDTAAERVIALGLPIDARISTAAKNTNGSAPKTGFKQADDTIIDVVAQIDATTEKVNAAIDGLETIDPTSQDIAIAIRQGLDKDRWFLTAHLSIS